MSRIGVSLTENGAMYPTATVSGIYIAHPDSQYFMVGHIDEEQIKDYARRRNLSVAEVRKLLNKNILYYNIMLETQFQFLRTIKSNKSINIFEDN